jgi:hypothetical protein
VHRHAGLGRPFDRVVAAPGIGDDAIVGIGGGLRPPPGMRRFVQRNGVDGYFHLIATHSQLEHIPASPREGDLPGGVTWQSAK